MDSAHYLSKVMHSASRYNWTTFTDTPLALHLKCFHERWTLKLKKISCFQIETPKPLPLHIYWFWVHLKLNILIWRDSAFVYSLNVGPADVVTYLASVTSVVKFRASPLQYLFIRIAESSHPGLFWDQNLRCKLSQSYTLPA